CVPCEGRLSPGSQRCPGTGRTGGEMTILSEVWAAYEQARGRWSGCDWPTHFGSLGLDLQGVSALEARGAARRGPAVAAGGGAGGGAGPGEAPRAAGRSRRRRLRLAAVLPGDGTPPRLAPGPTRRRCAEVLADEWDFAACVLGEIESDASLAEREAWAAV